MKTTLESTYVTCPIAMMATIIARTENNHHSDCQKEAEKMAAYYNSLSNYSELVICDVSFAELMAEEELEIILSSVLKKSGYIRSFDSKRFNVETTIYTLNCEYGIFKMILVRDEGNKITVIDFKKVELHQMNKAA